MNDTSLIPNSQTTETENLDELPLDNSASQYLDENLTAKLGGNYAKIIEFYDNRL